MKGYTTNGAVSSTLKEGNNMSGIELSGSMHSEAFASLSLAPVPALLGRDHLARLKRWGQRVASNWAPAKELRRQYLGHEAIMAARVSWPVEPFDIDFGGEEELEEEEELELDGDDGLSRRPRHLGAPGVVGSAPGW